MTSAQGPQHPLTPAANVASAPRRVLVPRGLPWLGIGLRLFLPDLLAGLVAMLAREWDCVAAAVLQSTDEAYLEADTTRLAAKVGGCVRRVPVEDFQKVKAGELLVEVVDLSFRCCLLTTRPAALPKSWGRIPVKIVLDPDPTVSCSARHVGNLHTDTSSM